MEKGNKVKDKTEESRERWQYLVSHFCNAEVELYPYETDSLLGKYLFKTNKIRLNKQFFDNIKVEGNKRLLNKEEILRAMWTVFHEINHAIENSSYLNLMKKRFPSLFPILRETNKKKVKLLLGIGNRSKKSEVYLLQEFIGCLIWHREEFMESKACDWANKQTGYYLKYPKKLEKLFAVKGKYWKETKKPKAIPKQ